MVLLPSAIITNITAVPSVTAVVGVLSLFVVLQWFRRNPIKDIPGPVDESSFWFGNLPDLLQKQVGETDFKWQDKYGGIVRFKGPLLEDRLFISDPKAIQYILQVSGYKWPRTSERRAASYMLSGKSITFAGDDDHKRHRKIMQPGFGVPETKALLPWFNAAGSSITTQWKDLIGMTETQSEVFNIPNWLSRGALDALGNAAFDYQFNALNDDRNPLCRSYQQLLFLFFKPPSNGAILFMSLFSCLPLRIQNWINDNLPSSRLAPVKETRRLALEVASDLVQSKIKELKDGEGKADLMSLFVKANMSQTEKNRMSEEEIYSQMRAIFIAGHETTANTIGWALLELCRNPEMQERLRKEIRKKEKEIQARGGDSFTVADLESIEYLSAVVKETLRFHPVSPVLYREAGSDDVIPLSNPIVSTKGEKIIEVPVPKGMKVTISVAAYNRTKELFGNDAHTFNPDRWLNQNQKLSQRMAGLNLYANLATFSAGVRSCIGWRFAVLEFQSFLVELINNFEFSLTKECEGLRREACLVMLPTIQGKVDQGPQLLLKVSVAGREQ